MRELANASSVYGASMGRSDSIGDVNHPVVFEIERLQWVDGDYDQGGAYWGHTPGDYIYRAEGDGSDIIETMFVRAKSVTEAKDVVRERYPNSSFAANSDVNILAAAYLEAALWSTHNELFDDDETGEETENLLDSKYEPSDEMLHHFHTECEAFLEKARPLLELVEKEYGYSLDRAGYDFWMTQSGSGVSFSDRGLGDAGDELSAIARTFSEDDLYVGDDLQIHSGNQYRSAPAAQNSPS